MAQIKQNIKVSTIEQVRLSNGRHIVYTFRDDKKYVENVLDFLIEGIEKKNLIIYVDTPNYFERVSNELTRRGFTKSQLDLIVYNDSHHFYASHEPFSVEQIGINFVELMEPHFTETKETRIWASVVWNEQDQKALKKRMCLHEHNYDCFVSENSNVLAVCAYNALTLPASFMNVILQTHEFHMTDNDFSSSHLYKKEPALLSRISEQIKLEEAKENSVIQAEKLGMASKLAAITAHEIGNPLSVIKGFLQLMQETNGVNGTSQLYLNTINSQVEKIEQVAAEFLVLANPQLGNKKEINVFELIESVIDQMKLETENKKIQFKIKIENRDASLFGDPVKLKQMLIHLVKNSIEAMDEGVITIESKDLMNSIQINVIDNGPGIPKNILNQIGEPFVTTKEFGTGLGLLLSKQIIADHDGNLIVESEVGKGATFKVSFPKR